MVKLNDVRLDPVLIQIADPSAATSTPIAFASWFAVLMFIADIGLAQRPLTIFSGLLGLKVTLTPACPCSAYPTLRMFRLWLVIAVIEASVAIKFKESRGII